MELAYSYEAVDTRRQKVRGMVMAADSDQAIYRLRRVELAEIKVSLAPVGSVRGWLSPSFNQRELALFYRTLADRMESAMNAVDSIESSAEFIRDPRLVQAIRTAALYVRSSRTHDALKQAGFPATDCALLEAVSDSGEIPNTLRSISERIDKEVQLKRAIVITLVPSLIAIVLLLVFFWGFVVFMVPGYVAYFKNNNLWNRMEPWIRELYGVLQPLAQQPELFTVLYFGSAAVVAGALISGRLSGVFRMLPDVGKLLDRWEHMKIWSAYKVMSKAGMVIPRIFRLLSQAATTAHSRETLHRASRLADNGEQLAEIVQRVSMPDYVSRYIKSAAPGKLDEALGRLLKALDYDAVVLSERVKWIGTSIGYGIGITFIFFVFRVTYWENFMLLRKLVS